MMFNPPDPLADDSRWTAIGKSLAQGYIDALDELGRLIRGVLINVIQRRPYQIAGAASEALYYSDPFAVTLAEQPVTIMMGDHVSVEVGDGTVRKAWLTPGQYATGDPIIECEYRYDDF